VLYMTYRASRQRRSSGNSLKFLFLLSVIILVLSSASFAETKDANSEDVIAKEIITRTPIESLEQFRKDLLALPGTIYEDTSDTWSNNNYLASWILAGGASLIMHNSDIDKNVDDNVDNHQVIDGFLSEIFNIGGGPGFHFAATGYWYLSSLGKGDDKNAHDAWVMMRALSTTGALTAGLKVARFNKTPNGKMFGWPSGHTSSSFAAASVLDSLYGPNVGVPAYLFAAMVGYRQIDERDHWASDVVFGAVMGWTIGHTVAGKRASIELAGFKVLPYTYSSRGEPVIGVNLCKRF